MKPDANRCFEFITTRTARNHSSSKIVTLYEARPLHADVGQQPKLLQTVHPCCTAYAYDVIWRGWLEVMYTDMVIELENIFVTTSNTI